MSERTLNVLVSTFDGLGLPRTLVIPTFASSSVFDFTSSLLSLVPSLDSRVILTTNRNRQLLDQNEALLSHARSHDSFLSLRLTVPLRGGKGGFGSQLRAAGGRMSSRRKKLKGDQNRSSRNLDGRRLRTVAEAKALAEYLATNSDIDRKKRDSRRKRWEHVIEAVQRRGEDVKRSGRAKLDGQWAEDRDEASERAREAVKSAMASGSYEDVGFLQDKGSPDLLRANDYLIRSGNANEQSIPQISQELIAGRQGGTRPKAKSYFGWDDPEDCLSEEEGNGIDTSQPRAATREILDRDIGTLANRV